MRVKNPLVIQLDFMLNPLLWQLSSLVDLVILVMAEIALGMAILVVRATRIRVKTNKCAVIVDLQVTLWRSTCFLLQNDSNSI